jgi:putative phosphoesterase
VKVGILGDIHGNADALNAVLNAASTVGVDQWLNTGDMVGYYFAPERVMEMLRQLKCPSVRGNHEEMLCRSRDDPDYLLAVEAKYGSGVRVALEQLSGQQLDAACGLPHPLSLEIDGLRILLSHGAPWNIDQYIYPDSAPDLIERFAPEGFDLLVTGHTHYPMVKTIGGAVLVNPGSVGQPRNRMPGAHWAVFDTIDRSVELCRTPYDCSSLVLECRKRHPELPYLADVLERVL